MLFSYTISACTPASMHTHLHIHSLMHSPTYTHPHRSCLHAHLCPDLHICHLCLHLLTNIPTCYTALTCFYLSYPLTYHTPKCIKLLCAPHLSTHNALLICTPPVYLACIHLLICSLICALICKTVNIPL